MLPSLDRSLWSLTYTWHHITRLWWAYFEDWSEIYKCVIAIQDAFPCFQLQKLEARPEGFSMGARRYAASWTAQVYQDIIDRLSASERDERFFPLAPYTCAYLVSFVLGLRHDAHLLPLFQERCEEFERAYASLLRRRIARLSAPPPEDAQEQQTERWDFSDDEE